MGKTDDQPKVNATSKQDWFKKPKRPSTPDSDWDVGKSIDFRPPQNCAELEYNFKECYKAVNDRLDWNKPKGKEYPFDLSKTLVLIMNQGHQVVHVDCFINNDLEYLRRGSLSKKYMTSMTKTKAAKYDIPGIKDMAGRRPSTGSQKLPGEAKYHQAIDIQFSDGTLTSVRTVLRDIASNLRMYYLAKRK
ncbi:hypothetical protein Tco_0174736 [Tanacetum coccineum]